jgi:hypothetical protein
MCDNLMIIIAEAGMLNFLAIFEKRGKQHGGGGGTDR